jgi:hypothetical protein
MIQGIFAVNVIEEMRPISYGIRRAPSFQRNRRSKERVDRRS